MTDINVSIVGVGSIAEHHFKAFRECSGVKLRGVMNRIRNSVERIMGQYNKYDSLSPRFTSAGCGSVVVGDKPGTPTPGEF